VAVNAMLPSLLPLQVAEAVLAVGRMAAGSVIVAVVADVQLAASFTSRL